MQWFIDNFSYIAELTGYHLVQAILPLVLGVIIAVPVAQAARLSKPLGGVILTTSALLYTVPSLAMFVLLPLILGTQVLDMINVIVALTEMQLSDAAIIARWRQPASISILIR